MQSTHITSTDNEKIKLLKKLKQKKFRDKTSMFFVENLKIISDALVSGYNFDSIYYTQEFADKHKEELKNILKNIQVENTFEILEKVNASFSELETPPGVCALYTKKETQIDLNSNIVYLNSISDPGNLGTILRSALVFDFKNIVLDENCADLYNAKTLQSAKDSFFKLNFGFDKKFQMLNKIKNTMPVFGTFLDGEDLSNFTKPASIFCLVFGNEAQGISKRVLGLVDKNIKIEMSGHMESLNVAISAGIIFYYLR